MRRGRGSSPTNRQILGAAGEAVQLAGVRIEKFRCEGVPSLVMRPAAVERPSVLLVGHIDVVDHGLRRHYRALA